MKLYFREGLLSSELQTENGRRIAIVSDIHEAAEWVGSQNQPLPHGLPFDDYYYLAVPEGYLKKCVCQERWHEDFFSFIRSGEASKEFLRHHDECEACQKATDTAIEVQGNRLSIVGKIIGRW